MKSLPYSFVRKYKTYLYSPEFSLAAADTLQHIHVDPCAAPTTQFIQADRMWNGLTVKTDGYTKSWEGNVFFNCDNYERPLKDRASGELIECPHEFHPMSQWVTKLMFEMESGRAKEIVGFFPCRMFKPWVHSLVLRKARAICYHTRKITFYSSELDENNVWSTKPAKYNNVGDGYMSVLFSGSDETLKRFVANYSQHGTVVGNELLGPL